MYYAPRYSGSYDWTYLIIIIALFIISMIVQSMVKNRYKKYSNVPVSSGLSGAGAAKRIMEANGVYSTQIAIQTGKDLSDYYDPKSDTIFLSNNTYHNRSVSAVGVACHEAGHAIQYAMGYGPVKLRMACIPLSRVTSKAAIPLILIGLILSVWASFFKYIAVAGIILFAFAVFIQIVTLPVEFDASNRALKNIRACGILTDGEAKGAKSILTAAAMTYVVATLSSIIQLLRFISIFNRR